MYPGGTWMGGIDPFGDIMGTSAGPAGEENNYLFNQAAHAKVNSHLHSSISSTHAGTQTQPHTLKSHYRCKKTLKSSEWGRKVDYIV